MAPPFFEGKAGENVIVVKGGDESEEIKSPKNHIKRAERFVSRKWGYVAPSSTFISHR